MADLQDGDAESALGEVERVPPMTLEEKFALLTTPVCLAAGGLAVIAVNAFVLAKVLAAFLPNFRWYAHHLDHLKMVVVAVLAVVAPAVVISGGLLVYPALVFRKMLRRKKETGSLLPQGEELAARRRKWKHPSWRLKVWPPSFFALIAGGWTYELSTAPHRLPLAAWSFPALAWVIVILVAIDCFFPRPDRLWTGICDSVAFGSLAAVYLIGAPHGLRRNAEYWIFPVLTGSIAILCAFWVIRDWRRGRAGAAAARSAQ